jgi:hypothetical protein
MSGQHNARQGNRQVTYVKQNESNKDPNVSPPIRVPDVERKVQELVRGLERAELTSGGGIRVSEVASCPGNVWIHILGTG